MDGQQTRTAPVRGRHTRVKASLLAGLLVGCGSQSATISVNGVVFDAAQIAHGRQLSAQYCVSCHGTNGEGQFPDAPTERNGTGRFGAPPHNGNGHTWHHGDAMLVEYVPNGGISLTDPDNWYPMPAFGEQLTLAHIKTFWNDEQRARQMQVTAAESERKSDSLQNNFGG